VLWPVLMIANSCVSLPKIYYVQALSRSPWTICKIFFCGSVITSTTRLRSERQSMVQGQTRKRLDIQRIAQIKNAAQVPLTLHGGSGTDDEDLRKAIAAGINIIHINTELRVAWRRGLEEGLSKQPTKLFPIRSCRSQWNR
jgi:hypothetical protein